MIKIISTTLLLLSAVCAFGAEPNDTTVRQNEKTELQNDSIRRAQAQVDSLLSHESIDLGDFVVKATKAAVVTKQDTIEFNAGSYKVTPNATVEDLLKKLPGVEVGSDGKITSNGKTITKVLVDGKEFFGEDTQMATKNLPSDLVDKLSLIHI